jgi:serine/threonine protein kinase
MQVYVLMCICILYPFLPVADYVGRLPFTAIREIKLLQSLKHPNVLTLYDIVPRPGKSCSSFSLSVSFV